MKPSESGPKYPGDDYGWKYKPGKKAPDPFKWVQFPGKPR